MTRYDTWVKRRNRYLLRQRRWQNSLPRKRSKARPGFPPVQKTGVRLTMPIVVEAQPHPRILKTSFVYRHKRRKVSLFGWELHGGGYAVPPYAKFSANSYPALHPYSRQKQAVIHWAYKAVHIRERPGKAGHSKDRKAIRAWTYWKYRSLWPAWDPKHRTPVDPNTRGEDDSWR